MRMRKVFTVVVADYWTTRGVIRSWIKIPKSSVRTLPTEEVIQVEVGSANENYRPLPDHVSQDGGPKGTKQLSMAERSLSGGEQGRNGLLTEE